MSALTGAVERLGILLLLALCSAGASPLDCSLPKVEMPLMRCKRLPLTDDWVNRVGRSHGPLLASDFGGECVPASAFEQFACLELDQDARFCPGEAAPYRTTVLLRKSGVSLDCSNNLISHGPNGLKLSGVVTDYKTSLRDITIKNCRIHDVREQGIDLKRYFRGPDLSRPILGHSNIHIVDSEIQHTSSSGIYVGQASRQVRIERTKIANTGTSGIYLEASSEGTLISSVEISGARRREALAVDSSMHNRIENSKFFQNPRGSVMLYHNCGELHGTVCPIRRPHGASDNLFVNNEFADRVVVASRQLRSYATGRCADLDGRDGQGLDVAQGNVFRHNRFSDTTLSIQDAENDVFNNVFVRSSLLINASVGVARRVPVAGIRAHDNVFDGGRIVLRLAKKTAGGRGGSSDPAGPVPALVKAELRRNRHRDGTCYTLTQYADTRRLIRAGVGDNHCP